MDRCPKCGYGSGVNYKELFIVYCYLRKMSLLTKKQLEIVIEKFTNDLGELKCQKLVLSETQEKRLRILEMIKDHYLWDEGDEDMGYILKDEFTPEEYRLFEHDFDIKKS